MFRIPAIIIAITCFVLGAPPRSISQDQPGDSNDSSEKAEEKVENTNPADQGESAADDDQELIYKMSITATERLLKSMDLEFEEIGNGIYRFDLDGFKVLLYNKKRALQLYAGFSGFEVTLGRINEWNRTKRFSKAYLDEDDDPCLESDLDLEGGIAAKAVAEFIQTFRVSVDMFHKHIVD